MIEIVGFGKLRCLNCGKLVNVNNEIHICNVPNNEWLNKQDKAFMQLSNGDLFDMKNKRIISQINDYTNKEDK